MDRTYKIIVLVFLVFLTINFTACRASEIKSNSFELKKPVRVITLKNETFDDYITYIASINSQKTMNLAFKSGGKISKLNVSIGDKVDVGTSLAKLEQVDINFALESAQSQNEAAKLQVEKARDTLKFMQDSYNDLEKLYEVGSISKNQLDEAKLKLDLANSDYKYSQSYQDQTLTNLSQKLDVKGELNLKSPAKGIVLDILNELGELISAGQPVVIIRNNNQTALLGVNQEDLSKINIETKVSIKINDEIQLGNIIRISEIPDVTTRTYEVEIMLEKSDNALGSIGEVKFIIGEIDGVKVPISSILSADEDYVYVVKDGKVTKTVIEIRNIFEGSALISGLEDGDQIVVEGMNNLKNFDEVEILD